MSLKFTGDMSHDNEEWCKIWRGIDLSLRNWHEEFDEFCSEHFKVLKMFTLMRSFWQCTDELSFMILKSDAKIWRKTDLWLKKWHEKLGKFPAELLKFSQLGIWWNSFVQSRKCMTLSFTEDYVSWQWRIMHNLKRNWIVISKLT